MARQRVSPLRLVAIPTPGRSRGSSSVHPLLREVLITVLIAAFVLALVLLFGVVVAVLPVVVPAALLLSWYRSTRRSPNRRLDTIDPSVTSTTSTRPTRLTLIAGGKPGSDLEPSPWATGDRHPAG